MSSVCLLAVGEEGEAAEVYQAGAGGHSLKTSASVVAPAAHKNHRLASNFPPVFLYSVSLFLVFAVCTYEMAQVALDRIMTTEVSIRAFLKRLTKGVDIHAVSLHKRDRFDEAR